MQRRNMPPGSEDQDALARLDPRVRQLVAIMLEQHDKRLSLPARMLLAADLAEIPAEQAIAALNRCRRELRTFPTVADVLARVDDGHPGAEEAWGMLPRSEADTA